MAVPEVNGPGQPDALWFRDKKKQPVVEQSGQGITGAFGPGGMNFVDTIKSTFSNPGNNCAGI